MPKAVKTILGHYTRLKFMFYEIIGDSYRVHKLVRLKYRFSKSEPGFTCPIDIFAPYSPRFLFVYIISLPIVLKSLYGACTLSKIEVVVS